MKRYNAVEKCPPVAALVGATAELHDKPIWQVLFDCMTDKTALLKDIQADRKPMVEIRYNGTLIEIPRGDALKYLTEGAT
jgi:hypothetical protein